MGSLSAVTVLDLSTVGPGARCTAALRDLGAAVIKVLAPAREKRVEPAWYAYGAHRNMKRLRIDLRNAAGRDAFLKLASGADVVVESFRPGVAGRLGIGYDDVRKINEGVVYASLSGYGQDGPRAQWAGHDLNYLAAGGFLGTQGIAGDGTPAMPGATVADIAGGGWLAALAICAALVKRAATGEGAYLDVAVVEGVLALSSLNVDEFLATGHEPAPGNTLLTGKYACYGLYLCRDGKSLAVGAIEAKFFANLCRALGLESLAGAQYDDARQEEVRASLERAFARKDRDEWVAELAPLDTCVSPVLSVAEATRDEQLRARGAFARVDHDGTFEQVAPALGERDAVASAVTFDGSDARELLASAGYSPSEIDDLVREGTVE